MDLYDSMERRHRAWHEGRINFAQTPDDGDRARPNVRDFREAWTRAETAVAAKVREREAELDASN